MTKLDIPKMNQILANMAGTSAAKRRKKKKKDPLKPKRARTAYTFFVQEHRPRIREAHPNLDFSNLGKVLGKTWEHCKKNGQSKYYEELAAADKIRADRERKVYEEQKARTLALSKPKPVLSPEMAAYSLFVRENQPKLIAQCPDLSMDQIGKVINAAWEEKKKEEAKMEAAMKELFRRRLATNLGLGFSPGSQ